MELHEIEARLNDAMELTELKVSADGSHYVITAVGECFDGLSKVRRQQAIYAPLMDKITDGTLHALSIKAFTPSEWQREKIFNG